MNLTMNILAIAILLLFPLGQCLCAAEPSELTVMTFNLRYASSQPPNSWPQRRGVVKNLIEQQQSDLIGTQEGLYSQIKNIAADLPQYTWIGTGRDGGSRGEFMAIFYRTDRFEPLEFDHFWLSDTPGLIGSTTWGNTNRRMVTWVKFRDRAGGDFYFFNTHFDHQVQPAREKSADLVLKRVEALKTELPVILVGDFNVAAGKNKVYSQLVHEGAFFDTWQRARQRGELLHTFHNYAGPRPGDERIDWILARGAVQSLSTSIITYNDEGQYPSDHFPVVARLRLGN